MNISETYKLELLRQYKEGTISKENRHDLEKMALDDPFLFESLEGYASIKDQNQSSLKSTKVKNSQSKFWLIGMASTLLILVAAISWWGIQSNTPIMSTAESNRAISQNKNLKREANSDIGVSQTNSNETTRDKAGIEFAESDAIVAEEITEKAEAGDNYSQTLKNVKQDQKTTISDNSSKDDKNKNIGVNKTSLSNTKKNDLEERELTDKVLAENEAFDSQGSEKGVLKYESAKDLATESFPKSSPKLDQINEQESNKLSVQDDQSSNPIVNNIPSPNTAGHPDGKLEQDSPVLDEQQPNVARSTETIIGSSKSKRADISEEDKSVSEMDFEDVLVENFEEESELLTKKDFITKIDSLIKAQDRNSEFGRIEKLSFHIDRDRNMTDFVLFENSNLRQEQVIEENKYSDQIQTKNESILKTLILNEVQWLGTDGLEQSYEFDF